MASDAKSGEGSSHQDQDGGGPHDESEQEGEGMELAWLDPWLDPCHDWGPDQRPTYQCRQKANNGTEAKGGNLGESKNFEEHSEPQEAGVQDWKVSHPCYPCNSATPARRNQFDEHGIEVYG